MSKSATHHLVAKILKAYKTGCCGEKLFTENIIAALKRGSNASAQLPTSIKTVREETMTEVRKRFGNDV